MPAEHVSSVSVRKPSWHGLSIVIPDYTTRDEMMTLAGQNWTASESGLYSLMAGSQDANLIDGWKGLVRSDNGIFLGAVKSTYEVVQNAEMWDLAEALLQTKELLWETAGVLREGRTVWVLVKLSEPVVIPGDNTTIYAYLRVSTTHDGTGALKVIVSNVRTVCWNTMVMGDTEAAKSGLQFSFRHSKNVHDRIDQARTALGFAKSQLSEFHELALSLAGQPVTDSQVHDFVTRFIPMPLEAGAVSDRIAQNIADNRREVFKLINVSSTIPEEHRRTSYGLFCAGIEFLDHIRAFRSPETYFNRSFENNGALKSKLATLAMEVAAA